MNTETLANNLRNAIASNDRYHVELYGEEACRRLMQQQRALDALKKRQDAARGAVTDGRDTEPATDENAREAELQQLMEEREWLREEWERLLEALGRDDARNILDINAFTAAPATVVLDELWRQRVTTTALCAEVAKMEPEPEPAKEPEPEPERKCRTCKWYVPEQLRCDIGWDGECHRYPEWSTRIDNDWCGEWEPR